MRTTLSRFSPLAAAALLTLAVRPALAQQTPAPRYAKAANREPAAFRTLAVYDFNVPRDAAIPSQVTVADSAGQLVASFRYQGAAATQTMTVDVIDTDLVLQGDTPAGPLTLRLFGQNDPSTTPSVAGRWWLGRWEGSLRSRSARRPAPVRVSSR
jgi:hypothetical protein